MERRELLLVAGLSLSTAIAGCNGGGDENSENGDENTSANGNAGDGGNGNSSENGGEENGDENDNEYVDSEGQVPEDLIREFFVAANAADTETLGNLLHSELPNGGWERRFNENDIEIVGLGTEVLGEGLDELELGLPAIPDGETEILVAATAQFSDGDQEYQQSNNFVLVTDDGQWRLWDLATGLFRNHPQQIELTSQTGVVGDSGEIEELRFGVRPLPDSGPVNLARLVIVEFIVPDGIATLQVGHHDGGPATGQTDPANVEPGVTTNEQAGGQLQDLFGVSVVTANDSDNLIMTSESDEYEIVIDTAGGQTAEDRARLPRLATGDTIEITFRTETGLDVFRNLEVPDLSGAEPGDEVQLQPAEK